MARYATAEECTICPICETHVADRELVRIARYSHYACPIETLSCPRCNGTLGWNYLGREGEDG